MAKTITKNSISNYTLLSPKIKRTKKSKKITRYEAITICYIPRGQQWSQTSFQLPTEQADHSNQSTLEPDYLHRQNRPAAYLSETTNLQSPASTFQILVTDLPASQS
ncbi:unnamed protein product [Camellia sinensis]